MYYLYLDESGETGIDYQNKEQPYFCIAGFIIKEDQLNNLEVDMQGLKNTIGFADDEEIHMKKMRKPERLSLLYEELWPIIENNCIGIVNTGLNKAELDQMLAFNGKKLVRFEKISTKIVPYVYGAYLTMLKFNHFLKEKKSTGRVFFDEKIHGPLQVEKIFRKFSNKELLGDPISWDMISIEHLDSKQNEFIQLADVLAYTINRANTLLIYPREKLYDRDNIILEAYSNVQKYSVSSLEYDIGAILPAILSNYIFERINELILKEKK